MPLDMSFEKKGGDYCNFTDSKVINVSKWKYLGLLCSTSTHFLAHMCNSSHREYYTIPILKIKLPLWGSKEATCRDLELYRYSTRNRPRRVERQPYWADPCFARMQNGRLLLEHSIYLYLCISR